MLELPRQPGVEGREAAVGDDARAHLPVMEIAPALRLHELEDHEKSHRPCQAEQGGGGEDASHGVASPMFQAVRL